MEYYRLLNFSKLEIVKFDFPGKLSGSYLTGILGPSLKSQFIITNKRLIIVLKWLFESFKHPFILIIPLEDIKEVTKETRIIKVKFKTFPDEFSHSDIITLKIGFPKDLGEKDRVQLMDEVSDFLTNSKPIENSP
jgi:hypothetical protein